jgi:hypothetical protein
VAAKRRSIARHARCTRAAHHKESPAMNRSKRIAFALISGALVSTALIAPASAGPTVLRDDQLKDLAVTPVLGRGYSIATNTFQSICLTDFPKTKASYNFKYKFEQIESDGTRKSDTSVGASGEYEGGGLGFKANVKVSGSTEIIDGKTYHNHFILVTIGVDSYYSSIDESKARIGDAARELLTANDVPGFFDACGMYYTRSIGRHAEYLSLFNYKTESTDRDVSFEAKLEAEIKGWGQRGKVEADTSGSIKETSSSKYLTIESTALGLGKDEKASLIAYDLDTFRQAVKDAFLSMQQEDTGMVISIEVVPWVENADFQRILKLQESKPGPDGKTVSPYAQKRILNQNGEFLAEVDRVTRAKLNVYYKAKQCRARIDLDFKADGAFRPELANANVVNHRSGAKTPLATLDAALAPDKVEQLFTEYRSFLYGTGSTDNPGAVTCVRDLLDAGITSRSHREIDSCSKVEQQFAVISAQLVDENCMPKLAP